MIIAISTDNKMVSKHFGRCEQYTIFETKDNKIVLKMAVDAPGHEPFLMPKFVKEQGANILITDGIGPKSIDLFERLGIKTISGIEGNVDDVINLFLKNKLNSSLNSCNHEN
jgi:predicted Fe-Mo cluster-binding NifX family protein